MRVQVLSSGSQGNCTLVRAGELSVLVDAGLTLGRLRPRLEEAGIGMRTIDHILVTHAHLDHARSVGALAKKQDATVHCPTSMMRNNSVLRAPRLDTMGGASSSKRPASPCTTSPLDSPTTATRPWPSPWTTKGAGSSS